MFGPSDDYGGALALLNGRTSRKVGNNTYARLEDDGAVKVRYHATDILTFLPSGEVVYNSGGWLTSTTKDRFNRFGAHGVRIFQRSHRWFVQCGAWENGPASDFYDGLAVRDGVVLEPVHAEDPDKRINRAIDRYVKGYTADEIARLVADGGLGDCMFCQFVVADGQPNAGKPVGDALGDHDHLREHLRENYRMAHLAHNAVKEAGYRSDIYLLGADSSDWMAATVRKCIRKYLRARLSPNTAR